MATISDLAVRLNVPRDRITRELDVLAQEWVEQGIKAPVVTDEGQVDDDAQLELADRL